MISLDPRKWFGSPGPSHAPSRGKSAIRVEGSRGVYTAIGYRSARIADKDGRSPSHGTGVTHEKIHRERLQLQSREFRRDNGLYAGMLRRARSYIIGRGFSLQCKTEDPAWNSTTEAAFKRFWKKPEITGCFSGRQCERRVVDELLTVGEALAVLTDRGKIQFAEAEQLKGPRGQEDGIERDSVGAPVGYWISPYDQTGIAQGSKAVRYSPDTVLYVGEPERASSSRAVPPCQAAFPMLHRINDVCDSEAIAWQMQARIAVVINRQSGLPVPTAVAREDDTKSAEEAEGDLAENWVTELDYALIFHGEPGDEVKGMERTAPAREFSTTLRTFLRLLGLPLGLPLELVLLDWTQSNYSQSRAVLDQVADVLAEWQDMVEDGFHRPVFEWWLKRAVAAGEIEARDDMFEAEWIRPTPPWLDKLKEAQAYGEQVDRGFTTYQAVCKSLDSDRESVVQTLKRETLEAIKVAQEIEAETGVVVPWEPFAGKKAPAPTPATAAPAEDAKTEDPGAEPGAEPKKEAA